MRIVTSSAVRLEGDVDLEATVATIPEHFRTKGMFFTRYVAALGEEWELLLPSLLEPAKHGRYQAFEGYPMRDYVRVFDRVARARFLAPRGRRSACSRAVRSRCLPPRRWGRSRFLSCASPATLLRYPDILKVMIRGVEVEAERVGARHVAVRHPQYRGSIEQGIGVVEGLVQTFDEEPCVEVTMDMDRGVVFDVSW